MLLRSPAPSREVTSGMSVTRSLVKAMLPFYLKHQRKSNFIPAAFPRGRYSYIIVMKGKNLRHRGTGRCQDFSWLPELKPGLDFIYSTQSPCLQNPGWLGRSPCTLVPVLSVILDLCWPLSMWGEHSFWVRFKGLPPTSELCNMAPYKLLWGFYTELFWHLLRKCTGQIWEGKTLDEYWRIRKGMEHRAVRKLSSVTGPVKWQRSELLSQGTKSVNKCWWVKPPRCIGVWVYRCIGVISV